MAEFLIHHQDAECLHMKYDSSTSASQAIVITRDYIWLPVHSCKAIATSWEIVRFLQ
jgi:hypothetical protein